MRFIKHIIALVISAVCLYLAFRGVDFGQALQIFFKLRWFPLTVFSMLCLAVFWVRAWRWKYFYRPEHQATVGGLTVANLIGFMSNNILPLRVGEMVRVLIARRKVKAPMSYTIASLVVERIFDTLCLLLCLMVSIFFRDNLPSYINTLGKAAFGIFIGGLGVLLIMRLKPHLAMKILAPLGRKVLPGHINQRFEHFLHTFTDGLTILRDGSSVLKIAALSLFHWWMVVFSYRMAFAAFSLPDLPWTAPYFTLGIVGIGVALPSAPAFVGPLHAAFIFALQSYGIAKSTATGFAVVAHLVMMTPLTVVGLALMWHEGLSLSQIQRKAVRPGEEKAEPEPAPAVQT